MVRKSNPTHAHRVRPLERGNAPVRKRYALFVAQYHTGKHMYCTKPGCRSMGTDVYPTLLRILSKTVGCYGTDKGAVLSAFKGNYWVKDMFVNEGEADDFKETVSRRRWDRRADAIWRQVMGATGGTPPVVVISAMKSAPASDRAYRVGKARTHSRQGFGVKMFGAIERHPELGPLFEPVFLSPWRDRESYRRAVRRILRRHALLGSPGRARKGRLARWSGRSPR